MTIKQSWRAGGSSPSLAAAQRLFGCSELAWLGLVRPGPSADRSELCSQPWPGCSAPASLGRGSCGLGEARAAQSTSEEVSVSVPVSDWVSWRCGLLSRVGRGGGGGAIPGVVTRPTPAESNSYRWELAASTVRGWRSEGSRQGLKATRRDTFGDTPQLK